MLYFKDLEKTKDPGNTKKVIINMYILMKFYRM